MTRLRLLSALTGLTFGVMALFFVSTPSPVAAAEPWVTVKGQVVWPKGTPIPARAPINLTADKAECSKKGPILTEEILVNTKNHGLSNVWVYLKPTEGEKFAPTQINPALAKAPAKTIEIDQPCCMFIPRIFAAREGDKLLVKNSSPIAHNINYSSDNLSFNQTIPAGGNFSAAMPLTAQRGPHVYACNIHPWMTGKSMVFDHPYFAVTDEDGKFEIKGVPADKIRIFYRHENGYHKGRDGAKGFPLEVKGDSAVLELPALEFELPK